MRAAYLLGAERRDVTDRPGKRARRSRRKASAADIALRAVPVPADFVTSPDQGGRRRLLERFGLARQERAQA